MRSLVLAGGGMRVAWQAGVVRALEEEGVDFDHVDGTSGGILTAAMILSGVSGVEMCDRWRGLPAAAFTSLLPLSDYVRGPWALPALGDAEAIIHTVFPRLGIDVDRMRQSDLAGTFQIVEFTSKECLSLEPADLDAELLAAGLSLPGWITPLRRDGRIYTDAVWMRDAGVSEAIRRGSDEIWLVWCIGNSPYWGEGPLEQYVHMIEMSAMGALLADFELARALGHEFTLHVITPHQPLPLDPEFYLGRISADALVAMGFRDAHTYLAQRTPAGVPKDASCTQMADPPLAARLTDRLQGRVGDEAVSVTLTVQIPLEAPLVCGSLAGAVTTPKRGTRYLADGAIRHEAGTLIYSGTLRSGGTAQPFSCRRELIDDPGWDAWSDFTTAYVTIGHNRGTLRMDADGAAALIASIEPVGAHGLLQRADVVQRLVGKLKSLRARH